MRIVMEYLINNAWKFSKNNKSPEIAFGQAGHPGETTYYVKDNCAGFDMTYVDKFFIPFQRLHKDAEFEGTGIGLATVQRDIQRHGGHVWAEGKINQGATFYFTLHDKQND